jgi:hypothetical protein
MSEVLKPEDVERYTAERIEEEKERAEAKSDWRMELIKLVASLVLNLVVIVLLIYGILITSGETSARFSAMLELVIGAIFGITATQVGKQ